MNNNFKYILSRAYDTGHGKVFVDGVLIECIKKNKAPLEFFIDGEQVNRESAQEACYGDIKGGAK